MQSKVFVQTFWVQSKTYVQTIWVPCKRFFQTKATFFFNILNVKETVAQTFLVQSKTFFQQLSMQSKILGQMFCDSKQSLCSKTFRITERLLFNHLGCEAILLSNILGIKQDFCSKYFDLKKLLFKHFGCKARL